MTRVHSLKQEGYGHRVHRSKKNRRKDHYDGFIPKSTDHFNKLKALADFNKHK